MCAPCGKEPINTSHRMKHELKGKHVPPNFYKFKPHPFVQSHRSNIRKSSVPCVISIVRKVKEKSDSYKNKNIEKEFFKIGPTTKHYKCQGYGHVTSNYPSPFKIAINDGASLKHLSLIVLFLRKSLLWLKSVLSLVLFLPGFTTNTTFSTSFTADPCCHYLFWSLTPSSHTVDTSLFSLMAYVRF